MREIKNRLCNMKSIKGNYNKTINLLTEYTLQSKYIHHHHLKDPTQVTQNLQHAFAI